MVGTLLVLSIPTLEGESDVVASESVASTAVVTVTGLGPSAGQSLLGQGTRTTSQNDDPEIPVDFGEDPDEAQGKSADLTSPTDMIWKRYLLGIDEAEEPQPPKIRTPSPSPTAHGRAALIVPCRAGQLAFEKASLSDRSVAAEFIGSVSDLSFGPSRHRSQPVEQGLDVFRRG